MINLNEKLIYTAHELKDYLNISYNAIYELLRTKQIASIKIGKKYLISKMAIKKFLETGC